MAILLVESSLHTCALFEMSSALHMNFPDNPEEFLRDKASSILKKLDIGEIPADQLVFDYKSESEKRRHRDEIAQEPQDYGNAFDAIFDDFELSESDLFLLSQFD